MHVRYLAAPFGRVHILLVIAMVIDVGNQPTNMKNSGVSLCIKHIPHSRLLETIQLIELRSVRAVIPIEDGSVALFPWWWDPTRPPPQPGGLRQQPTTP